MASVTQSKWNKVMNEIHAHNLLNLLKEKPLTRDELKAHFGEEVRFHTCKLNDLDLDSLLEFLLKRSKVIAEGETFVVNPERICNH